MNTAGRRYGPGDREGPGSGAVPASGPGAVSGPGYASGAGPGAGRRHTVGGPGRRPDPGRTRGGGHTRLAAVASALPGEPVDNAALSGRLGVARGWIEAFIGTRTRHFAVDLATGEVRYSLADLCAAAARAALGRCGALPGDLGFVVLATATPDALMPTTAAVVADRLGVEGVPCYQIQSGCSGAVQALALAGALLERDPDGRPGLVLGGDVCSKHLDLGLDFRGMPPGELVNYMLFGDGAGAAVVASGPGDPGVRLVRAEHAFAGLGRPPGQTVEWFGAADRDSGRPAVVEDYKAVEAGVPVLAREVLGGLLTDLGWAPDELDFLLPPQLSGRMTDRITGRLHEELGTGGSTAVSCVAETGNNGNALPFCQIERLLPRMRPGSRALGTAVESSKWIKAGFALEAAG